MRTFFCESISDIDDIVVLDKRDEKHLFRTLRAKCGETIELIDGKGTSALSIINDDKTLTITEVTVTPEPQIKIHLFVAPPKKAQMDQMLKQCAEIGIWSITPMITSRSVSTPEKANTLERWNTLLLEGCKQAKNPFVPSITRPVIFERAIEQAKGLSCFFGATDGESITQGESDCTELAWFVGPEGGFTAEEQQLMVDCGFNKLAIGRCVMRVETAAITGASLLEYLHCK